MSFKLHFLSDLEKRLLLPVFQMSNFSPGKHSFNFIMEALWCVTTKSIRFLNRLIDSYMEFVVYNPFISLNNVILLWKSSYGKHFHDINYFVRKRYITLLTGQMTSYTNFDLWRRSALKNNPN